MHITEFFKTILESDAQDDWQTLEHNGTMRAVYKGDINIRIESHNVDDEICNPFKAAWAINHTDAHAVSRAYNAYYGATLVAPVILVAVDGGRAVLPMPDPQTMTPGELDLKIAEIINPDKLDDYMKRSGFKYPQAGA